ncbi:MAG: nuclear transport factor 2 family protein [Longimicrobiales bacterium]
MRSDSFGRLVLALLLTTGCAGATRVPANATAAAGRERDALAVVERLFDGMRQRDTAAIRSTLHADARLLTAGTRDGAPGVQATPIDAFIRSIGGATAYLDERLHDTEVRVDGDLATVWTGYHFFVDGEFSHCGVDAFQLVRMPTGWQIVSIVDTRRREGCNPERHRG